MGYSGHRIRRGFGRLASAHSARTGVVRRSQRTRVQEESPAAEALSLPGSRESVADLLGGVCTNAAPRDVWKKPVFDIDPHALREARVLYSRPHLPQGSPTSPALANICAYRVDCRLAGLAKSAGAAYTRYA